jgi:hypothetical protein
MLFRFLLQSDLGRSGGDHRHIVRRRRTPLGRYVPAADVDWTRSAGDAKSPFAALMQTLLDALTVNDMDSAIAVPNSVASETEVPDGELWSFRAGSPSAPCGSLLLAPFGEDRSVCITQAVRAVILNRCCAFRSTTFTVIHVGQRSFRLTLLLRHRRALCRYFRPSFCMSMLRFIWPKAAGGRLDRCDTRFSSKKCCIEML